MNKNKKVNSLEMGITAVEKMQSDRLNNSVNNKDRHGKKVRITLDVAEELIKDIDRIRQNIGVDRGALIKVWLYERVQQENTDITH